jgi:hypothetical protein
MKNPGKFLALLPCLTVLAICWSCNTGTGGEGTPSPTPSPSPSPTPTPLPARVELQDGLDQGMVTATAQGIDVAKMSVTVTCSFATKVVIPTGTLFVSGAGDTQNMITARTAVVPCPDSPTPTEKTVKIEVYCINRLKDAPTGASSFTISRLEDTDPLRKLDECLEKLKADHEVRQGAVWLVSEHYLDMTRAEVVEKLKDYYQEHLRQDLQEDKARVVRELREKHPELADQSDDALLSALQNSSEAVATKLAEAEVKDYKEQAGPLLEACGFENSNSKFFQPD